MKLEITKIFETPDWLVINKPAGLAVHRDSYTKEGEETVADWFSTHYPEAKEVGEPLKLENGEIILKSGIVHRLDKETSGVMVLAKNQTAYHELKQAFLNRVVQKEYRAIVVGELKQDSGEINLPIGRSKKDPRKRLASSKAASVLREALTAWQRLENYPGFAYVAAYPKTGRTHQIRVHFKAINHPLVNDPLYGERGEIADLHRLALHAFKLSFPFGGQAFSLEAPLPFDFQSALDYLKSLC